MPLRALTIDFWNTMVVARTGGERRQAQRMAHLLEVAQACRPGATEAEVEAAYRAALARFDRSWRERHSTPRTSELVECIWEAMRVTASEDQHAQAVTVFEDGLLHGAPDFADGLEDALAWAAARYRLGVISDTMFSPGRVIRRLLEARGVLHHFDALVFSDETGFSKPDPRAFERAAAALDVRPGELVHVGDLRRTDVRGAQEAGAKALLFTGVHQDEEGGPEPDAVLPPIGGRCRTSSGTCKRVYA